jgi:hypothetical protein
MFLKPDMGKRASRFTIIFNLLILIYKFSEFRENKDTIKVLRCTNK